MKSYYFRLVPIISILIIIAGLALPLFKFKDSLGTSYSFYIWGYLYEVIIIEGFNIFYILFTLPFLWFIVLTIFNIRSIFKINKLDNYLVSLSEKWLIWGVINLFILSIYLLLIFFVNSITFIGPLLYSVNFNLGFYLLISLSLFLILAHFLYDKFLDIKPKKKDFTDINWLKTQVYELNRSIQEIADDQNASMLTIKKWIDKLEFQDV